MHVVSQGPYISDNGKMLLIELVREQEAIWNPSAPSYSRAELKFEAWRRVQDQMRLKGFDFTVNFLRKQWNHLLVYWKKDIKLKKRPGREWPFGRSMNYLCGRYGITCVFLHYCFSLSFSFLKSSSAILNTINQRPHSLVIKRHFNSLTALLQ
ncbi:hypothetical protein OESDEN_25485 [Oesophagostomum dentatum]|uniref:MADF domain-containing protein n=1 Tax=Oesophagostomum dentatum TaxID=61180 RepID=A0A0B1RQJ2_OESDE|nr:hypothetical protein OESDEN_25485 [Oesophagostomum dentatum]